MKPTTSSGVRRDVGSLPQSPAEDTLDARSDRKSVALVSRSWERLRSWGVLEAPWELSAPSLKNLSPSCGVPVVGRLQDEEGMRFLERELTGRAGSSGASLFRRLVRLDG